MGELAAYHPICLLWPIPGPRKRFKVLSYLTLTLIPLTFPSPSLIIIPAMALLPVPTPYLPPTTPSRGKQLRDLTQDALALFRREGFNPLVEMIATYRKAKETEGELDEDHKDALRACVKELLDEKPDPKVVQILKNKLESSTDHKLMCQRLKLDILKELAQYSTPKLRSVEHTGEINTGITITLGVQPKEVIQVPYEKLKMGREDTALDV